MIENCSEKNYIIIVLIIILLCLCAMCLLALDYDFTSVSSILCILIILGIICSGIYSIYDYYSYIDLEDPKISEQHKFQLLNTMENLGIKNKFNNYKTTFEPTAPTRNIPLSTFSSTPPPKVGNTSSSFASTLGNIAQAATQAAAQVGGDKSTDFFNFLIN